MIPQIGQHITCLLRNNILIEGIVTEWNSDGIQLKSIDEKSMIVVPQLSDIIMIKIFLEEIPQNKEKIINQTELEEQFDESYNQPSDNPLRTKSLAELKILMIEQEKQTLVNKLKNHHIGETRKVKYGFPGFFSKPSSK